MTNDNNWKTSRKQISYTLEKIIKIIERQVEFIIYLESCLIVYMLISCFKFILNVKLISSTLQP